ncbi:aspartate semialdehyde dehydrogenase [Thermaerobacter marianensis DSM 12885]|uniref:Aspartate-semialdehyde dehydrogenase n=1 Tax=Thermaerobacter marianensis (strain ATCC 700841 / DSM 12885 / JCM 10246 / 7p75a) TaxID=644966 RepID=E6SJT4_THEM7|nr:aspartate-semialdehyde dehydrogenase [Thermaerobacter marianensis]ADU51147.1 aspartate semialdehyde dehydrogenase [Thermaerobacter marianensis DSM 12885]
MGYRVAVVGATGLVGQQVLRVLEERRFPVDELRPLATSRSAGRQVEFAGSSWEVGEATAEALEGADFAFFAASSDISRQLAPVAARAGTVVIDKSNTFRMDPEVPLVVPEVNGHALAGHRNLIASPNCSTIQLVVALKPILDRFGLERVVVSTYQAVSGTGAAALDELEAEVRAHLEGRDHAPEVYPRPIAFNVLPHCDRFEAEGYTLEEWKLVRETRKILGIDDLPVTATAVRVPVRVGHSEAVWLQTRDEATVDDLRRALAAAPGLVVRDDPGGAEYPTPLEVAGRDEVFVGRIRRDPTAPRAFWLWVVADNLRKGAATNAVQIAEALVAAGKPAGR